MKKKFVSLKGLEKIKKEQLKLIKGGKTVPVTGRYDNPTLPPPDEDEE